MRGIAGKTSMIYWGDGNNTTCSHDGVNKDYSHTYAENGTFTVWIVGDLNKITTLMVRNQCYIGVNLDTLRHVTEVRYLYLDKSPHFGSLVAGLTPLTGISYCAMSQLFDNADITGDISVFSDKSSLSYLQLGRLVGVTGGLSDLSALANLSNVVLTGTNVDGDISDLARCPMTYLDISATLVNGYSGGSLSWGAINASFRKLNGLDAGEISRVLQDIDALANSDGMLDFSGCGVTYDDLSSGGKTAHINLIARSWDITLDKEET